LIFFILVNRGGERTKRRDGERIIITSDFEEPAPQIEILGPAP
jgi:hypothetical protein